MSKLENFLFANRMEATEGSEAGALIAEWGNFSEVEILGNEDVWVKNSHGWRILTEEEKELFFIWLEEGQR